MSHRYSASITSATSSESSQRRKDEATEFQESKQGSRGRTTSFSSDISLEDALPLRHSKRSWLPSERIVSIAIGICILVFLIIMFFSEKSHPPSGRYLQTGKASSDGSKTVVLASYPAQKLDWTKDVPDEYVDSYSSCRQGAYI